MSASSREQMVEQLEAWLKAQPLAHMSAPRKSLAVDFALHVIWQQERTLSALAEFATHRESCNVYSENPAVTGTECTCGYEEASRAVQA